MAPKNLLQNLSTRQVKAPEFSKISLKDLQKLTSSLTVSCYRHSAVCVSGVHRGFQEWSTTWTWLQTGQLGFSSLPGLSEECAVHSASPSLDRWGLLPEGKGSWNVKANTELH